MAHHTAVAPELSAGLLQICYILAVNANILADTGGPCTSADCTVRSTIVFPAFLQPVRNQHTACPDVSMQSRASEPHVQAQALSIQARYRGPGLAPEVQVPLCCK